MGLQMRESIRDSQRGRNARGAPGLDETGEIETGEAEHDAADNAVLLERALQRLAQQRRALAFFEQKWLAAQHDVRLLMDSQERTKERLARLTERARHLYLTAIHDELTGLLNRRMIVDRLGYAIVRAERNGKKIGVIFLHLRDFRRVSELHGQHIANQALQQIARRVQACVRASDSVGRYAEDKFVLVLPEIQRPRNTGPVLQKLRDKIVAPCLAEGRVIRVTADIGIAIYPDDARHSQELIRKADAAMCRNREKQDTHAGAT